MPYKITDNCIACGDCLVACEKNAIDNGYGHMVNDGFRTEQKGSLAGSFRIIESACDGCGSCVGVCPSGAIVKQ